MAGISDPQGVGGRSDGNHIEEVIVK